MTQKKKKKEDNKQEFERKSYCDKSKRDSRKARKKFTSSLRDNSVDATNTDKEADQTFE